MASNLKAFMAESAIQFKEVEYVASDRFRDENGNPIAWKLRILKESEIDKLRSQCQKRVVDPKTRQSHIETDTNKLMDLMLENCVVYPNLNDRALQDSYKSIGAVELAKNMLIPGEYTDLIMAIQEANGFDSGMGEKIKRAKN